jgi:prefoldin subunit 5
MSQYKKEPKSNLDIDTLCFHLISDYAPTGGSEYAKLNTEEIRTMTAEIIKLLNASHSGYISPQIIRAMNAEMLYCQENNLNSYPLITALLKESKCKHIINQWLDLNQYSNITLDRDDLNFKKPLFDDFAAAQKRLEAIIKFRDQHPDYTLKTKINQAIKLFSHNLIIHNTNKIIDDMRKEIDALGVDVAIPKTISANIEELNSSLNTTNQSLSKSSGQHYKTINKLINNITNSTEELNKIQKITGDTALEITKGYTAALNNLIHFINWVFSKNFQYYTADTSGITETYKSKIDTLLNFKDEMNKMIDEETSSKEDVNSNVRTMGGK